MSEKLVYDKPKGKSAQYLEPYCATAFRTAFVTCNDVFMPEYYKQFASRVLEMDVRSDDVWMCTYPKSGTTWAQEMVWCIANDVDLKSAEEKLPIRFPFLDISPLFDFRELMSKDPEMTWPDFVLNSVEYISNLPSPRFVKTHVPFGLLPEKLQQNETNAKIIHVVRNVRDTCVSFFHHHRLLEGYTGNFEQFCELFLDGNVIFGSYWNHVKSFWQRRNDSNMLILRYEDMKKDLRASINKTADFLGKTLSEDQMQKLTDHLSIENMKKNTAVNYEPIIELFKKYELLSSEGSFIRRGKVGEWKEVMNAELVQRFEKWENENLEGADSLADFLRDT